MLFTHGMKEASNDNEPFSFITLSAATERAISQLPKQEKNERDDEQPRQRSPCPDQDRLDAERRVRDILEMENRLRRKMN
jgi:hypothetical protein